MPMLRRRDPEVSYDVERLISAHAAPGNLLYEDFKPIYAYNTDRTLSEKPSRMQDSEFAEDQQLFEKRQQASVHDKERIQFGSAFFLSQPFALDDQLRHILGWDGLIERDCIMFCSAMHVFSDEAQDKPRFAAEVVASSTLSLITESRSYKVLARSCQPLYENVSNKMDSPRLATAPGRHFKALPPDVTTSVERDADFVYGVTGQDMLRALLEYRSLLLPNNLSASAGDVIAVGQAQIKHRCSTGPGMWGGPLWPLDHPCTFHGVHGSSSGSHIRANFNHAYSAHAALFVLNYARFVLPVLLKARQQDWPQPYMLQTVADYLLAHKSLLEQHTVDGRPLWDIAKAFFQAHNVQGSGAQAQMDG
ncbi:uncharacterized protein HaLaN_04039 [Haematococcus lacustris]|uniref:Uncharacterized protein n=1 Tax=Haematococcus lacustris TaxID=44745 RepID=A0A699YFZ5_HAELA|nr:uncharacterized protein HaLaN_04039 [Haematococcus lacustris]